MSEAIRRFLEETLAERDLWRSFEVRLVGVRIDRNWHNLFTRIWLSENDMQEAAPDVFWRSEVLLAERMAFAIERIDGIVESIANSVVTLGRDVVHYLQDPFCTPPKRFERWYGYLRDDLDVPDKWFELSAGRFLQVYAEQTSTYWSRLPGGTEKLERDLRQGTPRRYRDLRGLAREALGLPVWQVHGNPTGVEVLAKYPVRFDPDAWSFDGGILSGRIVARSSRATEFAEVRARSTNTTLRADPGVEVDEWLPEPSAEWSRRFHIDAEGNPVSVELRCGVTSVGFHYATLPLGTRSSLHLAYAVVDPHLDHLSSQLLVKPKRAADPQGQFEHAVARLISLAGWHTEVVHGDKVKEFVDVIALHEPRNVCLAIDCTVGLPDHKDKFAKLVQRREHILAALPAHNVMALAATNVARAEVAQPVIDDADSAGVILLCREDLLEILEHTRGGWCASDLLAFLRRRVPSRSTRQDSVRPNS